MRRCREEGEDMGRQVERMIMMGRFHSQVKYKIEVIQYISNQRFTYAYMTAASCAGYIQPFYTCHMSVSQVTAAQEWRDGCKIAYSNSQFTCPGHGSWSQHHVTCCVVNWLAGSMESHNGSALKPGGFQSGELDCSSTLVGWSSQADQAVSDTWIANPVNCCSRHQ